MRWFGPAPSPQAAGMVYGELDRAPSPRLPDAAVFGPWYAMASPGHANVTCGSCGAMWLGAGGEQCWACAGRGADEGVPEVMP